MVRGTWHLPSPPQALQNTSESPISPTSPPSPPIPNRSTPPPSRTPSSNSTNGPLTPPPRLHLRSIIPSPPLPPEYLATAPKLPYPWIWRCHLCHSVYRLGVTRRCLEDGHFFCSLPSPPPSPITPKPTPPTPLTENSIIAAAKKARSKRKRDKKRAAMRGCRAEFDYGGWSGYNIWRRELRNLNAERVREKEKETELKAKSTKDSDGRKEQGKGEPNVWSWDWDDEGNDDDNSTVKSQTPQPRTRETWAWDGRPGGRDCWHDCDFPSECHNERKAERGWEAKMREMRRWDEEWRKTVISNSGAGGTGNEADGGGIKDGKRRKSAEDGEKITASVGGDDTDWDGDGDTVMSDVDLDTEIDLDVESEADADAWSTYMPSSASTYRSLTPINNNSSSSSSSSRIGLAITTPSSSLEHENLNLGSLGTDCDGLGEACYQLSYTQSMRWKSVEGLLGESPPSSPLKEVSFGIEAFEVLWGRQGCRDDGEGEIDGE
ncbi:hypothetical protein BKA65DRAFT_590172 [Rhexocercosporidium sp. MPI-PUGE-AT-0058]|nr:hypothetical protein BKA65DRAFT_590172 [Rhexocercosporidium sp. MPI-PUGE-AT-0058]